MKRYTDTIDERLTGRCKWIFKGEIPLKKFFESKREREYFGRHGFVTLFLKTRK